MLGRADIQRCGFDTDVPQDGLNAANITAVLERMRGKCMSKRMGCHVFFDAGYITDFANDALDRSRANVTIGGIGSASITGRVAWEDKPVTRFFIAQAG